MDDCYENTCSTEYNALATEYEDNLNFDFSKLIDYNFCFIPCYYGVSNSEVYDY